VPGAVGFGLALSSNHHQGFLLIIQGPCFRNRNKYRLEYGGNIPWFKQGIEGVAQNLSLFWCLPLACSWGCEQEK